MFAYLTFELMLPLILAFIMTMNSLGSYHLDRYYLTGMTNYAFSDFILGDFAEGILMIAISLVLYVAGSIALTMLIFRKKELEF